MILPIKFLEAAEIESSDGIDWYEERKAGLGKEFREAVEAAISTIQKHPFAFPIVHASHLRKARVKKFPYTIFFTIQPNQILVYSVFHTSRNPIVWRGRVG